jgi:hypothetical protein
MLSSYNYLVCHFPANAKKFTSVSCFWPCICL